MNPKPDSIDNDNDEINDEMLPEYDFSGGARGKYYEAYQQATNIVVLDPDVAEVFRDSAAVNEALRMLARIARSLPQP